MFFAIIKKEFKQFFRSKGEVIMMFIFPIVLITTLSFSLKEMMNGDYDIFGSGKEYSIVYYTLDEDSKYKDGFIEFIEGVEEAVNIKFEKVISQESVMEKVDSGNGILQISVNKEEFSIYTSKNGEKIRSKVFRGVFESMLNQYAVFETIGKFNPEAFKNLVENKYNEYVVRNKKNIDRYVTSSEYYTFAELALIIFYVTQGVAESVYKETKLLTINRIRLSKLKEGLMLLGKVIFGVFIAILQILLVYVYSSKVLKVDWGENTIKFMALFIVFGIFASVVGGIIGLCAKNDTTVAAITNTIIFSTCALGGCYTPLSVIVGIPLIKKMAYLSPIYWINTAASSMVSGLESSAYRIALIIPIALSGICLCIYAVIMRKKGDPING